MEGGVIVIAGVALYLLHKYLDRKTQQIRTGLQTSSLDTDVDEKVKNLHYDMVLKLGGYFHPKCGRYWNCLLALMAQYLDDTVLYGKEIKNIGIIFEHLMARGVISYGEYDTIVKDFELIHIDAAVIIEETAASIRRIRSGKRTYADLKQQVNAIKRKKQEAEQQLRTYADLEQQVNAIKRKNQEAEQQLRTYAELEQQVNDIKRRSQEAEQQLNTAEERGGNIHGKHRSYSLAASGTRESNIDKNSKLSPRSQDKHIEPRSLSPEDIHQGEQSNKGTCRLLAQKYNLRDDCVVPVTDASNQEDLIIIYDPTCNTERKRKEFGEDVMIRNPTFVSPEGAIVSSICKTKQYFVKPEEKISLKQAINQHTKRLFASHSNLNIITTSPVKSRNKGTDTIECPCIVLVCSSKGYIPVGESRFPAELTCENNSFVVDVREGYCQFCPSSYSTFDGSFFHQNIKMGCSFGIEGTHNAGTIGPFVDDFKQQHLFLTCAHIVNGVDQNGYDLNFIQNMFAEQPDALKFPNPQSQGCIPQRCGQVRRALFLPNNPTSVDAAVVEITEQSRLPSRGEFAVDSELNLKAAGFMDVPRFESGEIHDDPDTLETDLRIVKFGARTHVTRGVISSLGTSAKPLTTDLGLQGQTERCVMKNQFEVFSLRGHSDFFLPGDSGSGVFAVNKLPTGEQKLTCIGMAIGCTSYGSAVVTPIAAVLDALGLPRKLKQFP